jgi:3-deoxy-D-manno-octulosonic-acid transferase
MNLFYSVCFTLGFILALPYFLFRAVTQEKYFSNLRQRLGFLAGPEYASTQGGIWIHAVSVGEVLAALPLIHALRQKFRDIPLLISTTTITGQYLAHRKLAGIAKALYFPLDWNFSVKGSLNRIRPKLVLILETEIWPNFLRECDGRGIPVLLINGRVSNQSIARYRSVRWFMKRILRCFTYCCMQSEVDLERIRSLGAAPERSEVSGNLKYDLSLPDGLEEGLEIYRRWLRLTQTSYLVVAGSTMKGEEILVLSAFRELKKVSPHAQLLLAPRHPERFGEVEELLNRESFTFIKRSAFKPGVLASSNGAPEVILLDSMGELAMLYSLGDVAFIGGSLVATGGHNPLEPALHSKAVLFGPHMDNFREIAEDFVQSGAAVQVSNEVMLAEELVDLYRNPARRDELGKRGFRILEANRGATDRTVQRIARFLRPTNS